MNPSMQKALQGQEIREYPCPYCGSPGMLLAAPAKTCHPSEMFKGDLPNGPEDPCCGEHVMHECTVLFSKKV